MKKNIIIIVFSVFLLSNLYSQNKPIYLNYNIFLDGQFVNRVITGNFLVRDTLANISFSFPFRYYGGNLEIETEYYEKIKILNKPIIIMQFEKDVESCGTYTTYHNYNIGIPYNFFNQGGGNIKIYNKESKKHRKYWRQKYDYIYDIRAGSGGTIMDRKWKSKKRMEQFRKNECDNG